MLSKHGKGKRVQGQETQSTVASSTQMIHGWLYLYLFIFVPGPSFMREWSLE